MKELLEAIVKAKPAATKGQGNNMFWFYGIVIVVCYVAGASLVMWLAERINEHGIGNGISIILVINIISSFPQDAVTLYEKFIKGKSRLKFQTTHK